MNPHGVQLGDVRVGDDAADDHKRRLPAHPVEVLPRERDPDQDRGDAGGHEGRARDVDVHVLALLQRQVQRPLQQRSYDAPQTVPFEMLSCTHEPLPLQ